MPALADAPPFVAAAVTAIPSPDEVRQLIVARNAELAVLRRLLRAAETKSRLMSRDEPRGAEHAAR